MSSLLVFNRVYRLKIQSVMLVFLVNFFQAVGTPLGHVQDLDLEVFYMKVLKHKVKPSGFIFSWISFSLEY
jgi:hypothetical protein